MASQTHGAVDALLGLLATAIKEETKLVGGVPGDMQFIKDEMDSMNGFLLHLTKTESKHDDQIRAWMKQVREIAYVAEDCVERYLHDVAPFICVGAGCCAPWWLLLRHPNKYCLLRSLATQILELKVRVREVGERRQRYGVTVPDGRHLNKLEPRQEEEDRREEFVQALADQEAANNKQALAAGGGLFRRSLRLLLPAFLLPSSSSSIINNKAIISKLPEVVRSEAPRAVAGILKRCDDEMTTFSCIKMLLCALYAYPYATDQELKKLSKKLMLEEEEEAAADEDPKRLVMVFCYSMLSTQQKSCLQYLAAFLEESEISRTSLVRRWVAEGLVGKEEHGAGRTPEEAGELCFNDLVFRGFIRPARIGDAGTVKTCKLDESTRGFVTSITGSENFVAELPVHLQRQVEIRRIVLRPRPPQQQPQPQQPGCCCRNNNLISQLLAARRKATTTLLEFQQDPMDELEHFLKTLPALYRLNVLDLGGCRGLQKRHLKTIYKVAWLRYLSLRNTDVSRLHPRHMKKLTRLETLDIRGTKIPGDDTAKIRLPGLKHLLAGGYRLTATGAEAGTARTAAQAQVSVVAVQMPRKIGTRMRQMETLSHVQVSGDGAELVEEVARLRRLRKLGVAVHGNNSTAQHLRQLIYALAGCLRSLSVWVTQGAGSLDISVSPHEAAASSTSGGFAMENLEIMGRIGLPSWIARADKLANVTLRDTEMDGGEALRRLGNVPSLRCLKLSRGAFTEKALYFKEVEFQALKFLVLEGEAITRVVFEADAAPALERIRWAVGRVHATGSNLISGINHLPKLKEIVLTGHFNNLAINSLSQATDDDAKPSARKYRCRYINSSSSDENQQIAHEVFKSGATLSLPAGVIN